MSATIRLSGFHPDDLIRSLGKGVTVYVVGGAVRDQLLGIASSDRDWVVTGATPEQMLAAGFTPVGADFPVFLHPLTHEEFALARTERKTAAGYRGFVFHAAPDVSLEADLQRRDLTVNAMAMSADGTLHDPWGGLNDLNARVLRHVSAAFAEDPVRILRLARFAARFPQFSVHADTLAFCADMVRQGEARALVAERVWQEVARLLMADAPAQGWRVLLECGALPDVVPAQAVPLLGDVSALQILQSSEVAGAAVADVAAWVLSQRWAAWMLAAQMPLDVADALAARWRIPNDCAELAHVCISQCAAWKHAATAGQIASVFSMSDLYRRSERFAQAVAVMNAVEGASAALPASVWMQLADCARALPVGDVAKAASASGTPVASAVAAAREAAIGQALAALLK